MAWMLLTAGLNWSTAYRGQMPLLFAAEKGQEAIVKMLLGREDVVAYFKDSEGRTLLSYAAEKGNEAIVKMLLGQEDVAADFMDSERRTPLTYSA